MSSLYKSKASVSKVNFLCLKTMSDDWFASTLASMVVPLSSHETRTNKDTQSPPPTITEHRIQRQIFLNITNQTPYKWTLILTAMFEEEKRTQKPLKVSKEIHPGETLDEYWLTLYMDNLVLVQSIEALCILNQKDCSHTKMTIQELSPIKRTYFQISNADNYSVLIKMDSKPELPHQWLVYPAITHSFEPRILSQTEE